MKIIKRLFTEEIFFLLTCPAVVWEMFFLYMPLIMLAFFSVLDFSTGTFTLEFYRQICNILHLRVIFNSFSLALTTAVVCFVIAYPVAYYLAFKVSKRFRMFLLFLFIIPSWTSLIVQIYAWFFLLEKNGFFSQFLYNMGIISSSCHLLNNTFSVIIGMVSCFLPFMIFPLYAVLEKMDKLLLEVSADLGANRLETFKRVIFPLSLPGVYAGCLLVFVPAFGEFAIPTLLGGSKKVYWGTLIVNKFLRSRDWHSGAALVLVGILLPALVLMLVITVQKIFSTTRKNKNGCNTNGDINKDYWTSYETTREIERW